MQKPRRRDLFCHPNVLIPYKNKTRSAQTIIFVSVISLFVPRQKNQCDFPGFALGFLIKSRNNFPARNSL